MKNCILCSKPRKRGKKYCSEECKGIAMKGRKPWNFGLTAITDMRVKKGTEKTGQTLKEKYAKGEWTPWIKGRTKESEPILQKVAQDNVQRTKEQYIKKGKKKWIEERPGLIRTGRTNGEKQKQAAREAMLNSLFTGKILLKKSKLEMQVKDMLQHLGIITQEVLVKGVGIPDFFLPEYNTMLFVDGNYYHSLETVSKRDKRQTEILKEEFGFIVLRLSEEKITSFNNNPEKLRQLLEEETKTQIK